MKSDLQAQSKKALAQLAKRQGIKDADGMSKEDLIKAIVELQLKRSRPPAKKVAAKKPERVATGAAVQTKAVRQAELPRKHAAARSTHANGYSAEEEVERSKYDVGVATKDLSRHLPRDLPAGYGKDRIVSMVRDPYWLHCYWELKRSSIERAEAALGQEWHTAKPILRVLDVSSDGVSSTAEAVVRDIEIHGGCHNWYVDVPNPPRSYRIDIGYLAKSGRFYVLARSNVVTTPRAGVSDIIDENWADVEHNYEKIYAMSGGFDPGTSSLELKQLFEERLRRPMGSPVVTSFGSGAFQWGKKRKFFFELNAELIVYGATEPNAKVTLQGEPVSLRPDGTFTMRFSLPDGRQIILAAAVSGDGVEERTIVLAVERNTKQLEPMIHNGDDHP